MYIVSWSLIFFPRVKCAFTEHLISFFYNVNHFQNVSWKSDTMKKWHEISFNLIKPLHMQEEREVELEGEKKK